MWHTNISHLFPVSGNLLFYSLSSKSRIMNSCRIGCAVVRNRDSNLFPFNFGLNSQGSSSCREPPQVHRACLSLPAPGVPRHGEAGCDFWHFRHWQTLRDWLPSPLTPPCSLRSVTVAWACFATGLSCWCHEITSVEGVKAYFLLPKAGWAFISAEMGIAIRCSESLSLQVLWDRAGGGSSGYGALFLPGVCWRCV